MRISARNALKGKVVEVERGSVNAVVKIDIGGGQTISSMITMDALNDLGVSEGSQVTAIIKSSNVIIAVE